MSDLKKIIEESFSQYSAAVIQSRALVDARDGLKPSARQIFYSMKLHKLTSDKPHKKTMNAVGMAMADFYIHGDSSCEGVIMRAGQSFAMRYPLVDVKGNAGTLISSGSWAAPRYTESRLSKISGLLFDDIKKDTIGEWRDSYDNTKQYPAVLPSKGFYNIVNGTQGIGIGMSSSIPQYNLTELNKALIHLIDNPDCDFDEIYCAPDFATGAILYNEDEVKESMKNGSGAACKLRSVVEFDNKERCFIVTEIPYGVYTNTICGELEEIINGDNNPGIDRFNDLTGKTPLIKIYLNKKSNPDKILRFLFKETSLQYHYSINFTMLDKGKYPRVFGWKDMLQAHIDHEKEVYRKSFEYDLSKIDNRIHIINGLLICMANINEVVSVIKSSDSPAAAALILKQKYLLDDVQAKEVLEMKLSRLANLEVKKLENELASLKEESKRIHYILDNKDIFYNEIKKGWMEVSKKYGDSRRTKIIEPIGTSEEPMEIRQLSCSVTSDGAIYVTETSSLYSQKRNGVGNKFKLDKGEYIINTFCGSNTDKVLFFGSNGNFYHMSISDFILDEKQYISSYIDFKDEKIVASSILSAESKTPYIMFLTKKGFLKKSKIEEYNLKRRGGAAAIKLEKDDVIVSALFINEQKIGILSKKGNFIIIETNNIRPIGRVSKGVVGIKLNNDEAVSAKIIDDNVEDIVSISEDGYIKATKINDFRITGRGTVGVKLQSAEALSDFLPLENKNDVLVLSSNSSIRISYKDIPILSRGAQGVKAIKLIGNSKVKNLFAL